MHRIEGENTDITTDPGKNRFRLVPPYTTVTPEFMNMLQEEIAKVITDAGLKILDQHGDTWDQLAEAIAIGDLAWVLTVGSLADLDTVDKSSIVNAINEVAAAAVSGAATLGTTIAIVGFHQVR